ASHSTVTPPTSSPPSLPEPPAEPTSNLRARPPRRARRPSPSEAAREKMALPVSTFRLLDCSLHCGRVARTGARRLPGPLVLLATGNGAGPEFPPRPCLAVSAAPPRGSSTDAVGVGHRHGDDG